MALTYYGDFLSDSEPHRVTRICKTRVCAPYFEREVSGSYRARILGRRGILQEVCVEERRRMRVARRSGEGWAVYCRLLDVDPHQFLEPKQRDMVGAMRTESWRRQCDEVGSAGVWTHHVHQKGPDLKFISKTVMSMNAKSLEITKSRLRKDREVLGGQASVGVHSCIPDRVVARVHGVRRQRLGPRS